MKKNYLLLQIVMIILFFACANSDEDEPQENKEQKIAKAVSSLITQQEKEGLIAGKSLETIVSKNTSNGGIADLIESGLGKVNMKNINKNSDLILNNNKNSIIVFDNVNSINKILETAYGKEGGSNKLENSRFIFVNRVLPLYKEEKISDLSEQYKFKYEVVDYVLVSFRRLNYLSRLLRY